MKRVLLICSVHREVGEATAAQLHWLLDRLRPEAIFLEHAPSAFAAFLDGSCGTVESAAVMRYRSERPAALVPVDLPPPLMDVAPLADELFDRIEEVSSWYRQLATENGLQAARGGFAYLNSPMGFELQAEMHSAMREVVAEISDPRLNELYASWSNVIDGRELAMIAGVEAFAAQVAFARGVLIVGAAHRPSLLEKTRLRPIGSSEVTWDFEWCLGDAAPGAELRQDAECNELGEVDGAP